MLLELSGRVLGLQSVSSRACKDPNCAEIPLVERIPSKYRCREGIPETEKERTKEETKNKDLPADKHHCKVNPSVGKLLREIMPRIQ